MFMLNRKNILPNTYYILNSKGTTYNTDYYKNYNEYNWPNILKITSIDSDFLIKGIRIPSNNIFVTHNIVTFCNFYDELIISNTNYINFLYDT